MQSNRKREDVLMAEEKVQKPINTQKIINHDLRKPIGFIGGGVCLILFVIFWIYISSDE